MTSWPVLFRLWFVSILVFGLVISSIKVQATHALGAELTYEHVGNNEYKLRLSFYYDCNSSFTNIGHSIRINSSCYNDEIELDLLPPVEADPPFNQYLDDYEILLYCEASNCNGGTERGMREYVYEGTVTLPPCSDYTLVYAENARSGAIATVNNPDQDSIYVEAFLNNFDAPGNSSPKFDLPARPIICSGVLNTIYHTATDNDGDLLVYSLYAPMTSATTSVDYQSGYSATTPVMNNWFSFTNGVIEVEPTEQIITLLGIRVDEYRDGVHIGTVMRDIQVTVEEDCAVSPSGLFESDTLVGYDADSLIICTNDTVNIDIYLDSVVPGPNYFLTVGNLTEFPGAVFTTEPDPDNSGSVIGHFTWVPDLNNVGSETIVFQAYNDNCPIVDYSSFSYSFFYHDFILDPSTEQLGVACNDSVELSVQLENPIGVVHYEWPDGDSTATDWVGPGSYTVTVVDSLGCLGRDSYEVYVNNYPVANFTVDDLCLNESVQVEDLSINFAETGEVPLNLTSWSWDFGDGSDTVIGQTPTHMYSVSGIYEVTLVLENENNCLDTANVTLTVNPLTEFNLNAELACLGNPTQFENSSIPLTGSVVSWQWDFGDLGAISSDAEPQHIFSDVGMFETTLVATTDQGCVNDTIIEAIVVDEARAEFSVVTKPNCNKENLTLYFQNESVNATDYLWDFGEVTDTAVNPIYETPDEYGPFVTLVAYAYPDEGECSDTTTLDTTGLYLIVDFEDDTVFNVITPNGDGLNECLQPFWHENYSECYRLRIWDRWGMFIYDSDKVADGHCWPGTDRKGQPVSDGTFFFVAEVNNYSRSGSVMVKR